MEQFRLRDIEEFDSDFVELLKNKYSSRENKPDEPSAKDESVDIFSEPNNEPKKIYPAEKKQQEIYDKVFANNEEEKFEEQPVSNIKPEKEKEKGKEKAGGYVAIKVISLVLLFATVITFIGGCFISVFLDNNGANFKGYYFNTQCSDFQELGVRKGDLIISKSATINEFNANDFICVPAFAVNGCNIEIVDHIYKNGSDEIIHTLAIEDNDIIPGLIDVDKSYGKVVKFVPQLGKIITFGMQNSILVCVLFTLIAALWCIVLLISERKITFIKNSSDDE